jgi:hypothetical protein
VFVVKVDEEGNVVDATPRESTVSPEMVAFYKKQAMKMRFEPKEDNASPAPISTGTYLYHCRQLMEKIAIFAPL